MLFSALRRYLTADFRSTRKPNQHRRYRPMLECLEGRSVPSIDFIQTIGTETGPGGPGDPLEIAIPPAGVAEGHSIIVQVVSLEANVTVHDTRGNFYSLDAVEFVEIAGQGSGVFQYSRTFSAHGVHALSASQGDVIQALPDKGNPLVVSATEFSGLSPLATLDRTSTASFGSGSGTSSPSTGFVTPLQANELLIGTIAVHFDGSSLDFLPGAGYTALPSAVDSFGGLYLLPEFQITSEVRPYRANGTLSSPAEWSAVLTTYRAAEGGQSPTPPTISINDVAMVEGNAGARQMIFTVILSQAFDQAISVQFFTSNGTASSTGGLLNPRDYDATSGVIVFQPGQTTATIVVTIRGDVRGESDETFFVNLANASFGTIADAQGMGTILDDDKLF